MKFDPMKILNVVICASILIVAMPKLVSANDYRDGLQAYINGEYVLAQQYWLKAADAKDAKSMFNLGLLHEQNRLQNAALDKALNWYRLAADNGYAPAGFHLAQRMLERGGSDDDAIALIRDAAGSGYAPALRYLNLGRPSDERRSVAKQKKAPLPRGNSSPETEFQSENWINRQREKNWTIQLLAFKSKQQVLEFIEKHDLQKRAAYFSEANQGEVFFKLVYGSYNSKDKATFARQNLSSELQQHGPWLRTWASVQKVTKR